MDIRGTVFGGVFQNRAQRFRYGRVLDKRGNLWLTGAALSGFHARIIGIYFVA